MGTRLWLATVLFIVSGCMSESERLAQVLSRDSGLGCDDRKAGLETIWRDSVAPLIRKTLMQSATWSNVNAVPGRGDVKTGETDFQVVLSDFVLAPSMLVGNQAVSMGNSCEQIKAHFSLQRLEAESTTLMSACISIPLAGTNCDKSTIRLKARARTAMVSVDVVQRPNGFSFDNPRVTVALSEMRLADPMGEILDGKASVVFSRFQPSWEEAISQQFENTISNALVGVFASLKCDMEKTHCTTT